METISWSAEIGEDCCFCCGKKMSKKDLKERGQFCKKCEQKQNKKNHKLLKK